MAFKRNFQPQRNYGTIPISFLSRVTDGKHVRILPVPAKTAYPDLPCADFYTIDARIKAGVPLTEVNSVLLDTPEKQVNEHLSNFVEDYDKSLENV